MPSTPRRPRKDSIILADFENQTGDPVFDTTPTQAFAIQMEQSPVLNLVSQQNVRQSMQYLGKIAQRSHHAGHRARVWRTRRSEGLCIREHRQVHPRHHYGHGTEHAYWRRHCQLTGASRRGHFANGLDHMLLVFGLRLFAGNVVSSTRVLCSLRNDVGVAKLGDAAG